MHIHCYFQTFTFFALDAGNDALDVQVFEGNAKDCTCLIYIQRELLVLICTNTCIVLLDEKLG